MQNKQKIIDQVDNVDAANNRTTIELRTELDTYEQILKQMPIAVYINNLMPFKQEWVRGGLYEHIGYTNEDMVAMTPEEFNNLFEWPSKEVFMEKWQEMLTLPDNTALDCEYRLRCKDGRWIDCYSRGVVYARNEDGMPTKFLASTINIDPLKQIQMKLVENKRYYKTFFEHSPEYLAILDCDFKIIDINTPLLDFIDHKMDDVKGRNILNFISKNQQESYIKLGHEIRENDFKYHYQTLFINKKQQEFYIDVVHWPVLNDDNNIVATVLSIKDITVQRKLESELVAENQLLKKELSYIEIKDKHFFDKIITKERSVLNIFKYLESIAVNTETLFITGETGTGKELLAESFYKLCKLKGNFTTVNVAGLDDQMFADMLFGHKKGAFTGADCELKGLIENAKDGVLFLDEIGDLSSSSQVKLLRLLQNKEYYRLGSDEVRKTNARIVAATNRNLLELIKENKFRADLYYRLTVHTINLPPLRDRYGDIPLLVEYYLREICKIHNRRVPSVDPEIFNVLAYYEFPGNVRELRNMLYDALNCCQSDNLSADYFKHYIKINSKDQAKPVPKSKMEFPLELPSLEEVRETLILEALKRTGNNISQAAKLLKIERSALSKAVKRMSN